MIVIGDTHGKTDQLVKLLDKLPSDQYVVQLGDMGLGFKGVRLPDRNRESFGFIRGNHDDPDRCRLHENYLGDYGYLPAFKAFFIGGAFSIDWKWRTPGVSWWEGEELSYAELDKAVEAYAAAKPEIVLSHECPTSVNRALLLHLSAGSSYFAAKMECANSRTCGALERMFEIHQPKEWMFGHYHIDWDYTLNGTHFRCNAELSPYKVGDGKVKL